MGAARFQRARRPEQVQARRDSIVAAARQMLGERGVAQVSLRELSDRIGLAKSNVLRYFDSREAIFLEVLDQEWSAWLDRLEVDLAGLAVPAGAPPYQREVTVGRLLAGSLADRPLLCELFSTMASVLERNIGLDAARRFKRRAGGHAGRLAGLVHAAIPGVAKSGAWHFALAVHVMIAGLWPYTRQTETVAIASAELGYPSAAERFVPELAEGFVNQLVGLVARAAVTPRPPFGPLAKSPVV